MKLEAYLERITSKHNQVTEIYNRAPDWTGMEQQLIISLRSFYQLRSVQATHNRKSSTWKTTFDIK